jgi:hypothetical protein
MVESTSPTSGLSYALPAHSSDADAIQKFVERNNSNPVVAVQGLGFVGAVMSLVVANAPEVRYAVIGLDAIFLLENCGYQWRRLPGGLIGP